MGPNDEMGILGYGDDGSDPSSGSMPAPPMSDASAGPKMISIQMPVDVAQNFMDAIGQQLSLAQPQPPAADGSQPTPEDLTAPGAGEQADEEQLQGE